MNKSKDREICIIGGGMGSISAAIYLRSKGYKVSLYEKTQHWVAGQILLKKKDLDLT